MAFFWIHNPMTQRRIRRFREVRRAYYSLIILAGLYLISLGAELICNDVPFYVRYDDRSYFPIFQFHPEDTFTGSGRMTRPDFKAIQKQPDFQDNPDNRMIFPPFPYGPYKSIEPADLDIPDQIIVNFTPMPRIGAMDIRPDHSVARYRGMDPFLDIDSMAEINNLTELMTLPPDLKSAIDRRFRNLPAPRTKETIEGLPTGPVTVSLSTFTPRADQPDTVRLIFREAETEAGAAFRLRFDTEGHLTGDDAGVWETLSPADQAVLSGFAQNQASETVDPIRMPVDGRHYTVHFERETVRFPYPPVGIHFMGIDDAGRDVFARIFHGLRTSLTFGFLLVIASMTMGILAGAIQGYYAGLIDITAQRLIEIWNALPFLYVMILMGAVYGRSFSLLLVCYALFNWIGISYYIRAEFLRLRKQPFVEAAHCLGIPTYKVIFKHILPNAMIPVITFFPFSLVGAIGALAALDYLGFGLPPPTPSWGELLYQAQLYRWAWWLILYPSISLFSVMLMGVFVGEGIRNAYDPKQFTRME
mgnify:FL=1